MFCNHATEIKSMHSLNDHLRHRVRVRVSINSLIFVSGCVKDESLFWTRREVLLRYHGREVSRFQGEETAVLLHGYVTRWNGRPRLDPQNTFLRSVGAKRPRSSSPIDPTLPRNSSDYAGRFQYIPTGHMTRFSQITRVSRRWTTGTARPVGTRRVKRIFYMRLWL